MRWNLDRLERAVRSYWSLEFHETPFPDNLFTRPYFDRDQQAMIVEIRRRNVGVNGQPILFRATGSRTSSTPRRPKAAGKPKQDHRDVLLAVRELGLTQATLKDVDECVASLFPDGQLPDHGDLIRRVFLSLNGRFSRNKQA